MNAFDMLMLHDSKATGSPPCVVRNSTTCLTAASPLPPVTKNHGLLFGAGGEHQVVMAASPRRQYLTHSTSVVKGPMKYMLVDLVYEETITSSYCGWVAVGRKSDIFFHSKLRKICFFGLSLVIPSRYVSSHFTVTWPKFRRPTPVSRSQRAASRRRFWHITACTASSSQRLHLPGQAACVHRYRSNLDRRRTAGRTLRRSCRPSVQPRRPWH